MAFRARRAAEVAAWFSRATQRRRRMAWLSHGERVWRAYCNNESCGYTVRRECGAADWRVLRALEPVSMGAGVIPASSSGGGEGDVMYMRARFELVVGSRDSEAFYMMNPDRAWLQQPSSHAGHDGWPQLMSSGGGYGSCSCLGAPATTTTTTWFQSWSDLLWRETVKGHGGLAGSVWG
uniref:Uncharacterized protein n=2 Tax=Setaria viridis TaxID=4556 RepID=A0A4U6W0S9_SETVI|nr:hypothetical protein SEVIR_2G345200v2 [Setaria viridis]